MANSEAAIDIPQVEQCIGYRFRQPSLLEQALTHKSYVNELKDREVQDNERLEFLGDAVLSLVISEHVALAHPRLTEGQLSKLRARLVSETTLAAAARRLDLGRVLRLGRGEELTQGRDKDSLLADALEALIAAVYLDGGLEAVRSCTLKVLEPDLRDLFRREETGSAVAEDHKTKFQEWCQKRHDSLPQYVTVRETGPDHQKSFEIQVTVQGQVLGRGTGRSKKEAEQMAARQALEKVMGDQ